MRRLFTESERCLLSHDKDLGCVLSVSKRFGLWYAVPSSLHGEVSLNTSLSFLGFMLQGVKLTDPSNRCWWPPTPQGVGGGDLEEFGEALLSLLGSGENFYFMLDFHVYLFQI